MKNIRLITILGLTVLLTAAAGCGAGAVKDESPGLGSPDIIGTITEVQAGETADVSGTIGLEVRKTEAGAQLDKYVITIKSDSHIYHQVGDEIGSLGEIGFSTLQVGQRAEVWLAGPVAESFPMQATAKFIVISGAGEPQA